jgi:RNA recognition motif-containing protein
MRIFVGNLPWSTTEEALARLFAPYGLVASTQIAPASMGSGARVGFVEMPDMTEARAAIAGLQGTGTHLRRDTVIPQWFQASKAAAASDGHAVYC